MASFKVNQSHSLSLEDAKKRLDELFTSFASKFGTKQHWEGDDLIVSGSGGDIRAQVTGNSIDIEVKLGLAASVFKGQVESNMKAELEKNFGS